MTNDPDQIRADIERTRTDLSENVDAVRDRVSPGSVVKRQRSRVQGAMSSARERVMGAMPDVGSGGGSPVDSVKDTMTDAPTKVRERTEGNPLAAGLVAFGVGWLASAIIPASKQERQAAGTVKEYAQDMANQATDVAKEMAEDMREPAQQAMESVKSTAAEGAQTVREEGTSAAQDIKDTGQESVQNVRRDQG
ncbi:DUF3618 domain-containing protein [Phytoactinopolyspora alkaliphila]|uniref:DUF3618 domain-containing protein n=1 Tax=Phytoactinopolyspora alkaliphila TaxID=1783498 RepID=A0A6N9YP13_9ACTN|nr:DUF3618 domain-containing protein [Phytoactinopolyspora alkaliphila]NED96569.1 DUF3618 domain-containing protein [Phytoactinopolyspora alkaliphila]